jgi:hypothetical protein
VDIDKINTFNYLKVLTFHIQEEKPLHGPFNKQQMLKAEEPPRKLRGMTDQGALNQNQTPTKNSHQKSPLNAEEFNSQS